LLELYSVFFAQFLNSCFLNCRIEIVIEVYNTFTKAIIDAYSLKWFAFVQHLHSICLHQLACIWWFSQLDFIEIGEASLDLLDILYRILYVYIGVGTVSTLLNFPVTLFYKLKLLLRLHSNIFHRCLYHYFYTLLMHEYISQRDNKAKMKARRRVSSFIKLLSYLSRLRCDKIIYGLFCWWCKIITKILSYLCYWIQSS
jgi:hypothetical protein